MQIMPTKPEPGSDVLPLALPFLVATENLEGAIPIAMQFTGTSMNYLVVPTTSKDHAPVWISEAEITSCSARRSDVLR